MRTRFLFWLLFLSLGGVVAGLLLLRAGDSSVTLGELSAPEIRDTPPAFTLDEIATTVRDDRARPQFNLDMEALFYALLGLCGILLALRTLLYAARVYHHQHWSRVERSAGAGGLREPRSLAAAPRSVLVSYSADAAAPEPEPGTVSLPPLISPGAWKIASGYGLTGRMIVTFTAIIAVFGLLTVATVYFALTNSLRRQAIERAQVAAVNLSDSSPGFVLKKNFSGLRALLRKFGQRRDMAYVLVENSAGQILAHSFAVLPQEVKGLEPRRAVSPGAVRRLRLGQSEIFEVTAPILEGRIGAVRVGIWRDAVDAEIFQTVMPLIKIIALVIAGAIVVAVVLVWQINRPIRRLVNIARSISRGDLDTPSLGIEDNTEFGELSRALERMRSSVKAAMIRLGQER